MNLSLNSPNIFTSQHDFQRLKQLTNASNFDRYFPFDESSLLSVENHSDDFISFSSDPLEYFDENVSELKRKILSKFCSLCSKIFSSDFGLNSHTNMSHPNQSMLCSDCQTNFRSHRALKIHQQRYHSSISLTFPNYNYISSYLVVPFSSNQFPMMCDNACTQNRLPLGQLSSKLFVCSICQISFPCSRTLKYHSLHKHEFHQYQLCKETLDKIIEQISLKTFDEKNEFDLIQIHFERQASQFGLVQKANAREKHRLKTKSNELIYPKCSHPSRTCANLCLKFLPSYEQHIRTHQYQIPNIPKGNPFSQGSIVSKISNNLLTVDSILSKDSTNSSPKRKSMKRNSSSLSDISLPAQSKKKSFGLKSQPVDSLNKTNETRSNGISRTSILTVAASSKKVQSKTNHIHTRSLSSNNLLSKAIVSSPRSLKRSRSPIITLAVEQSSQKRRRQRRNIADTSPIRLKLDDDVEQENDDDEILLNGSEKPKQRQVSSGSIEYIHTVNTEPQVTSSLNNIENLKSNSKHNDEETLISRSPPSPKKLNGSSTSKKTQSKTSMNDASATKSTQYKTNDDEHIRVRCKVCGDILEGRSLFSKHVLTMHSHLLNKNMANRQQQMTIVR